VGRRDNEMAKESSLQAIFDVAVKAIETSSNISEDVRNSVCESIKRTKALILRRYENVKAYVKPTYMRDADGLLDRHKVAACFMVSLLTELKLSEADTRLGGERLKEQVAVVVGLSLLRTWITNDNENHKNEKIIAFLDHNGGFVFPPPVCDVRPYVENWLLELYYNQEEAKKHHGSSPVLSISGEMFLIESYNRVLAGDYPP